MSRCLMVLGPALLSMLLPGLLAGTPAPGYAHPPKNTPTPSPQNPTGTIKSVNVSAMSVVLTVGKREEAQDLTVTVNVKTVISVDDKIAKIADLKAGMKAVARIDSNNVAINLAADNQTLNGVIKSLDLKAPSLVIKVWEDNGNAEIKVGLNEKTVVKIDGKNAKLEDIKEGMRGAVRTDGSSVVVKTAPDAKK